MMDYRIPCLALFVLLAATGLGRADEETECVQKLLPCQPYLTSGSPPATCCGPLKEAVSSDTKCLCNLFSNPGFLQGFNVTQEQALQLPKHCGVEVDTNKCKSAASSPASASTPSTSSSGSTDSSSSSNSTDSSSSSSTGNDTSENTTSSAAHVAYLGSSAYIVSLSLMSLIISAF